MSLTEYSYSFGTTSQKNECITTTDYRHGINDLPPMIFCPSSTASPDTKPKEIQSSIESATQQTHLTPSKCTSVPLSPFSSLVSENATPFYHSSTEQLPTMSFDQPATSTFGRSSSAALLSDWSTSFYSGLHQNYSSESTHTTHGFNTLPLEIPIVAKKAQWRRKSAILSRIGSCVLKQKIRYWSSEKTGIETETGANDNNDSNIEENGMTFRLHQPNRQSRRYHRRDRVSFSPSTRHSLVSSSSTVTTLSTPSTPSSQSFSSNMIIPRWQGAEQASLGNGIIKEKSLDDMTTFSWDRLSLAVGRAKKACKDLREILPSLTEKLKK